MTQVPHDVRRHIGGYLPVDVTTYGHTAMQLDRRDPELLDEMLELGLDPVVVIANERLRQREERRLLASPVYELVKLLYGKNGNQTWTIRRALGDPTIPLITIPGHSRAIAQAILGPARRLGFEIYNPHKNERGEFEFWPVHRGIPDFYGDIVKVDRLLGGRTISETHSR